MCFSVSNVAVTVSVEVPAGVLFLAAVLTVSLDVPLVVPLNGTEFGMRAQLPFGGPSKRARRRREAAERGQPHCGSPSQR